MKAKSSPKPAKKIDSKGRPEHSVTGVPGYGSKGVGTPKWVSGPAKSAEGKAK